MDYKLLTEVIIISGLAIPVVLLCRKINIPVVVGFLVSGIIINPSAEIFNIMDHDRIDILAELGVICLLFTIGLEFSLKQINELKKPLFIGGSLQVGLTISLIAALFFFFGKVSLQVSIFYGCVISLSSTALVLSFLQKSGDITMPYGRMTLTVLIFQDIISVLMVILFPLLGSGASGGNIGGMLINLAVKLSVLLAVSFVSYKWIVPKLLYYVAKTQSRELFMISILFVFLFFVGLSGYLKISLALGAFISGIIIAESPYSHRALGGVMPFKDVFTSIFFVSIGIMLDMHFAASNILILLGLTLIVLLLKAIVAGISVSVLKYPPRVAFLSGIALCQIGEFSFVLFQMGLHEQLISEGQLNYLLGTAILSMVMTPFLMQGAPKMYEIFAKIFKIKNQPEKALPEDLKGHVIIVGFGVVGRRVAFGAKMAGLKYIVIESNPDTVKKEKEKGVPIFYGDATQEDVLEYAKIEEAAAAAITIPGNTQTYAMTELVRRKNPELTLIVRARFETNIKSIEDSGATYVVADEKEASFEMLARILKMTMFSKQKIQSIVEAQKISGADELTPGIDETAKQSLKNHISNIKIPKKSPIAGKSLIELDFRRNYDLIVAAVMKENGEPFVPNPQDKINAGDVLMIVGKKEKILEFAELQNIKKDTPEYDEDNTAYDRS